MSHLTWTCITHQRLRLKLLLPLLDMLVVIYTGERPDRSLHSVVAVVLDLL